MQSCKEMIEKIRKPSDLHLYFRKKYAEKFNQGDLVALTGKDFAKDLKICSFLMRKYDYFTLLEAIDSFFEWAPVYKANFLSFYSKFDKKFHNLIALKKIVRTKRFLLLLPAETKIKYQEYVDYLRAFTLTDDEKKRKLILEFELENETSTWMQQKGLI